MRQLLLSFFLPMAAALAHPGWGLIVTAEGDYWISDAVANQILRVDRAQKIHVVRTGVHSHWLWQAPDGAIHGEHLWYDQARNTFPSYPWRITPAGRFEQLAQTPDRAPRDAAGRRYVAKADRIERQEPSGAVQPWGGLPFAGVPRGHLERIMGMTLDGAGQLYVADIEHGVVRRVDTAGRVMEYAKSGFNWTPWGLFWKSGELYVLEHSRYVGRGTRIVRIRAGGRSDVVFRQP